MKKILKINVYLKYEYKKEGITNISKLSKSLT